MLNIAQLAHRECNIAPTIYKLISFEEGNGKERLFDVWFHDNSFYGYGCYGDKEVALDSLEIAGSIMEDIDSNIYIAKYADRKIDLNKMSEKNKDLFRLAIIEKIEED